jgi:hypothetical protein
MMYIVELVSEGMTCYTKFHDGRFGYPSNTVVIASTIWEIGVLVLLMGQIYEASH